MHEVKGYFFSNVRMKCRNECTFSKVKSIINLSDFEENVQNYCMVVWPFEKTYFALHSQFLGFPKKWVKVESSKLILQALFWGRKIVPLLSKYIKSLKRTHAQYTVCPTNDINFSVN